MSKKAHSYKIASAAAHTARKFWVSKKAGIFGLSSTLDPHVKRVKVHVAILSLAAPDTLTTRVVERNRSDQNILYIYELTGL